MSANGEISVAVQAEGVDDATGELGGEGMGGGPGGGGLGGGDGDGGGGRGKGGALRKLLVRIAALLAFLGPLLDAVKPITAVMTAFVAPLASVLLRLLQPVLRFMLQLLPGWFNFIGEVNSVIGNLSILGKISTLIGIIAGGLGGAKIGAIAGSIIGGFLGSVVPGLGTAFGAAIGAKVGAIVGGIVGGITGGFTLGAIGEWLSRNLEAIRQLPGQIANAITNFGGNAVSGARDFLGLGDGGGNGGGGGGTQIAIGGGLAPFIDELTSDGSVDFP